MSDRNLPDVSQIAGVSRNRLPQPRAVVQTQSTEEDLQEEMAQIEPNQLQRERRASSIQDHIKTQREMEQDLAEAPRAPTRVVGSRDPLQGHDPRMSSFQHPEEQQEEEQQEVAPAPIPRKAKPIPGMMKSPKVRREVQELFTLGKVQRVIEIAGFSLTFSTLTADEYTKAWTMASIYPDGTSRDRAIQQFMLAYSVSLINETPPEMLCNDTAMINSDIQTKRAWVYSKMPSELVAAFFNEGFVKVHKESQKLIEDISKEGASTVAGFQQNNLRLY